MNNRPDSGRNDEEDDYADEPSPMPSAAAMAIAKELVNELLTVEINRSAITWFYSAQVNFQVILQHALEAYMASDGTPAPPIVQFPFDGDIETTIAIHAIWRFMNSADQLFIIPLQLHTGLRGHSLFFMLSKVPRAEDAPTVNRVDVVVFEPHTELTLYEMQAGAIAMSMCVAANVRVRNVKVFRHSPYFQPSFQTQLEREMTQEGENISPTHTLYKESIRRGLCNTILFVMVAVLIRASRAHKRVGNIQDVLYALMEIMLDGTHKILHIVACTATALWTAHCTNKAVPIPSLCHASQDMLEDYLLHESRLRGMLRQQMSVISNLRRRLVLVDPGWIGNSKVWRMMDFLKWNQNKLKRSQEEDEYAPPSNLAERLPDDINNVLDANNVANLMASFSHRHMTHNVAILDFSGPPLDDRQSLMHLKKILVEWLEPPLRGNVHTAFSLVVRTKREVLTTTILLGLELLWEVEMYPALEAYAVSVTETGKVTSVPHYIRLILSTIINGTWDTHYLGTFTDDIVTDSDPISGIFPPSLLVVMMNVACMRINRERVDYGKVLRHILLNAPSEKLAELETRVTVNHLGKDWELFTDRKYDADVMCMSALVDFIRSVEKDTAVPQVTDFMNNGAYYPMVL